MIKSIIFDLGGVFVSLDRAKCLDAFTNKLGFNDFGDYLSAYAQSGFFALYEDGAIDSKEFRDFVREHSTNKEASDSVIDEALGDFLVDIKREKVEMLIKLKERYNLYLLSNINPIAWAKSKRLFRENGYGEIEVFFDKLYLSYEMKCSKPGDKIFQKLIEDAGINPSETLFVDDAPANIETGLKFGLNSLLYNVEDSLPEKVMEALSDSK